MHKHISAISCSIYALFLCSISAQECKRPSIEVNKTRKVVQNVTIQTILSQHCRRKVRLVLSLPKGRSFVFLIAYTVSSSSYKLESSHRAFDSISLNRPTAKITPFSPFVSSHDSWLEGRENCGCHLILMKDWSEKQTQSDSISGQTHH